MEETAAAEVLRQVKAVLDKYGVEFWLDCGALLGVIREGKFISWDTDIDLSTWQKNTAKVVAALQELRKQGFVAEYAQYGITIRKEDISLSIGLWQIVNDKAALRWGSYNSPSWMGKFFNILFWSVLAPHYSKVPLKTSSNAKDMVHLILARMGPFMPRQIIKWAKRIQTKFGQRTIWLIPAEYVTSLSTIDFYETQIKIPGMTEEYLSYRYGNDWRVPKKDWVTMRDDGAVFCARDHMLI